MMWCTFNPILDEATEYYNVTTTELLQFSNIYMYFYVLSIVGASFALKNFAVSLSIAMALSATGGWIKFLAGSSYEIAVVGQCICAFS